MGMLTDTKARNIRPDSPQLAHGGVTGLVLIPTSQKGHGKWVLRYVSPTTGKRRNAGLGSYPEVGVAEAGKLGMEMREQIASRQDPLELKRSVAIRAGPVQLDKKPTVISGALRCRVIHGAAAR